MAAAVVPSLAEAGGEVLGGAHSGYSVQPCYRKSCTEQCAVMGSSVFPLPSAVILPHSAGTSLAAATVLLGPFKSCFGDQNVQSVYNQTINVVKYEASSPCSCKLRPVSGLKAFWEGAGSILLVSSLSWPHSQSSYSIAEFWTI